MGLSPPHRCVLKVGVRIDALTQLPFGSPQPPALFGFDGCVFFSAGYKPDLLLPNAPPRVRFSKVGLWGNVEALIFLSRMWGQKRVYKLCNLVCISVFLLPLALPTLFMKLILDLLKPFCSRDPALGRRLEKGKMNFQFCHSWTGFQHPSELEVIPNCTGLFTLHSRSFWTEKEPTLVHFKHNMARHFL